MFRVKETRNSYVIDSDGINHYYKKMMIGNWVGKVVIPKAAVTVTADKVGAWIFCWGDGDGINRAPADKLFMRVASGSPHAPDGARAIQCRRL